MVHTVVHHNISCVFDESPLNLATKHIIFLPLSHMLLGHKYTILFCPNRESKLEPHAEH